MYTLSQSIAISNVINCINYVTKFAFFQQIIRNNIKNVLYKKNAYKIIIEINCQILLLIHIAADNLSLGSIMQYKKVNMYKYLKICKISALLTKKCNLYITLSYNI